LAKSFNLDHTPVFRDFNCIISFSLVVAAGMGMLPTPWGYWHQADIRANDHERPKRVGACRSLKASG
jgi:hypothetical protein